MTPQGREVFLVFLLGSVILLIAAFGAPGFDLWGGGTMR